MTTRPRRLSSWGLNALESSRPSERMLLGSRSVLLVVFKRLKELSHGLRFLFLFSFFIIQSRIFFNYVFPCVSYYLHDKGLLWFQNLLFFFYRVLSFFPHKTIISGSSILLGNRSLSFYIKAHQGSKTKLAFSQAEKA